MIDLDDIENTILSLEQRDTTYAVVEKLAALYTVRDHLTPQRADFQPRSVISGDSDFLRIVSSKDCSKCWNVMDELMATLAVCQPKVYNRVMDKIRELE